MPWNTQPSPGQQSETVPHMVPCDPHVGAAHTDPPPRTAVQARPEQQSVFDVQATPWGSQAGLVQRPDVHERPSQQSLDTAHALVTSMHDPPGNFGTQDVEVPGTLEAAHAKSLVNKLSS